jgi:protein-tyrosine phosphatase
MATPIFWIGTPAPGRFAIMPHPQGGARLADEIEEWREAGIAAVLRLLTVDEVRALELGDEEALCRATGIELLSFPIPDMGVPQSLVDTLRIASALADRLRAGETIVVHCRGGIGRSSLIAASTLLQFGGTAAEVLAHIGAARGMSVPETDAQRRWIEDCAAARGGTH